MFGTGGYERDQNRYTDKGAGYTPKHAPEKYCKQHHEGGDRNCGPCNAGFYVATDDKLEDVEADEYDQRSVR